MRKRTGPRDDRGPEEDAQRGGQGPDFELPDDAGNRLRLSDLCRERVVLLLFYPADFGMICSIQMGELRDIPRSSWPPG